MLNGLYGTKITKAAVRLGWGRFRRTPVETGFPRNRFGCMVKTGFKIIPDRFGRSIQTGLEKVETGLEWTTKPVWPYSETGFAG